MSEYRMIGGPLDGQRITTRANRIEMAEAPEMAYHALTLPSSERVMEWHECDWVSPAVIAIRRTIQDVTADSLDAAWAEAEAALLEGGYISMLGHQRPDSVWVVQAQVPGRATFGNTLTEVGSTPAAALRALAAKLREVPR
jgi:hypothetical protein